MIMKTIMLTTVLCLIMSLSSGCRENLPGSETMHSSANPSSANTPPVTIRLVDAQGKPTEAISTPKVIKTDKQWKDQLTREQYEIARGKGTEPAFCGLLNDNKEPGIYTCVCCDLPLFSSNAKFNSGTGWPSFFQPVAPENVINERDTSYGMVRIEILCARCDAHLGHVFEDGPRPTGLRYCLNSASMKFVPQTQVAQLAEQLHKDIQPVTTQPTKPQ